MLETQQDRISRDETWLATIMVETDRAKEAFGIEIVELERGRAVLTMPVTDAMVNGFGITHGGLVFTLADTAFAYACNEDATVTVTSYSPERPLRARRTAVAVSVCPLVVEARNVMSAP